MSDHRGVAVITVDDGKANALGHDLLAELDTALDGAADAAGLALIGRPGKFCAGFDLSVMRDSPESAIALMAKGAKLALRLFGWPAPTVLGVTGHALAMGAVLLSCGDLRVGADGDFKLGLNEVAIGLPVPEFALELTRVRLCTAKFHEATALARIYSPREAVEVGYLDEVVAADDVPAVAAERAGELAERLDRGAFAATRSGMRARMMAELDASLGGIAL